MSDYELKQNYHNLFNNAVVHCKINPDEFRETEFLAKTRFLSHQIEQIAGSISNLKVEILDPVFCKGFPKEADFKALDKLATTIAEKHKEL